MRVPAPTHAEVERVLQHVAGAEQIQLPDQLRQRIAQVGAPPLQACRPLSRACGSCRGCPCAPALL